MFKMHLNTLVPTNAMWIDTQIEFLLSIYQWSQAYDVITVVLSVDAIDYDFREN